MKSRLTLTALALTFALAGCKHTTTPAAATSAQPAAVPASTPAPADAGAISGVIDFKGTPPARIPIDMSADPACTFSKTPNLTQQIMVDHGHLANVYVYIKSGAPSTSAPAGTPPVLLDQKGCRYIPHVIAVQQGGAVRFLNSDITTHNVHIVPTQVGNKSLDISETPGGVPQLAHFNAPEVMIPVRCNNHPWMEAFINVAPNPYFAVTGADGSFTIKGLPPGNYTLAAVQEKLGELDIPVTVRAKSTTTETLTYHAGQ